jgi:hypothetical protein
MSDKLSSPGVCLLYFLLYGCVLQLKANMLGTEYLLRGRGGDSSSHKGFNAQLLAVNYKPTINHIQAAPRTMTAVLPVPESKVRPRARCTAACSAQQLGRLAGSANEMGCRKSDDRCDSPGPGMFIQPCNVLPSNVC